MRSQIPAGERLTAEVAAVTGDTCGHSCDHHVHVIRGSDGPRQHKLRCLRGADHVAVAERITVGGDPDDKDRVAVDQHLGRMPDGTLVFFGEDCCADRPDPLRDLIAAQAAAARA